MTSDEFEKQPRGTYLFDWWVGKRRVSTLLGVFTVEFQMGVGDTNPPDDAMLTLASELMDYAESHSEYLLDIVFGYYLFAAQDPDWLKVCSVPRGLSRGEVADFLRKDRTLVVSRHLDWEEPYDSAIHIVPLWDEEHALTLDFRDCAIVAANDSKFKLKSGVFYWVDN
jgi:hypothetical protein